MRVREVQGVMTVPKLMGVVAMVLVLCACALLVAGCGSTGASGLYPVSVDGKWGYIDKTGVIKIQPQFGMADDFSEGLAPVSALVGNQERGYINTSGTMVIQPQFYLAAAFSEGLAMLEAKSGQDVLCGFIDKTGRLVIPAQYEWTSVFSEGLCAVMTEKGGQQEWGYIDKTGTMVIQPQPGWAADFSEGLASPGWGNGFIDTKGDEVIQLPSTLVVEGPRSGFSEGLAIIQGLPTIEPGVPPRVLQGYKGYIDKTGAVVIKPQFDSATAFREGLAAVGVTENDVTKWGYIDKMGAWVIQPQYDDAGFFSEGLAPVGVVVSEGQGGYLPQNDRFSFIDMTGKVVFSLQQGQVPHAFSGGLAKVDIYTDVTEGPDSMAYVDTTGKVIWQGK